MKKEKKHEHKFEEDGFCRCGAFYVEGHIQPGPRVMRDWEYVEDE